jgi:hypothetical protein
LNSCSHWPHISRILLRGRIRLIDHHADDEHCERQATHSTSCATRRIVLAGRER